MQLHYHVAYGPPASHLLHLTLEVSGATGAHLDLAMPAWIPGDYTILDSAKHVTGFEATGPRNRSLRSRKIDKQTWRVELPSSGRGGKVTIRYRVYANTLSCSFSQLDETHVHITGGVVFLYPVGHQDAPCTLALDDFGGHPVHTSLEPREPGGPLYAESYDRLIDCPVNIGPVCERQFTVRKRRHTIAVHDYGREPKDRLDRIASDCRALVRSYAGLFGGLPYEHYLFLFHLHPTRATGGALEHADSTHLTLPWFLDSDDEKDYERLQLITAHEYFHTWNVKRIRPAGLGPFDYSREAHTPDLWVAEGLTDYYAFIGCRRAGIWDHETLLRWLALEHDRLLDMPGRLTMSLAEASYETWTGAFWQLGGGGGADSDLLNSFVDYYNKGLWAGMMLDFELRLRTDGACDLDEVYREAWRRFGTAPEGFEPGAFEALCEELSGVELKAFFERTVHKPGELPIKRQLARFGIKLSLEDAERKDATDKLRRRVMAGVGAELDPKAKGPFPVVRNVTHGSPAEDAGVQKGDEIVAIDGERANAGEWFELYNRRLEAGRPADFALLRHDQLLHLSVTPRRTRRRVTRLTLDEKASSQAVARRDAWLGAVPSKKE